MSEQDGTTLNDLSSSINAMGVSLSEESLAEEEESDYELSSKESNTWHIQPWKKLRSKLLSMGITPSSQRPKQRNNQAQGKTGFSMTVPVTMPHGFQAIRTYKVSHPPAKDALYVSSTNIDIFATLDNHKVQVHRSQAHIATMTIDVGRNGIKDPVCGLNRWIYISKWKVMVISTLHLELKVIGINLQAHTEVSSIKPVLSLEFVEETDELIAGGVGNIRIWHLTRRQESGQVSYHFKGPRLIIQDLGTDEWITNTLCNLPGKKLIASMDNHIFIYDYTTGARLGKYSNAHDMAISCMCFYKPTQYLVSASKDSIIKVWTSQGFVLHELHDQSRSEITGMVIPNSNESNVDPFLIAGYFDGMLRMWNIETGQLLYKTEVSSDCLGIKWMRHDTFYHFSHEDICIWNLNRYFCTFAKLGSNICSIKRIETVGRPARLLITAEDCSTKLLSPINGETLGVGYPPMSDTIPSGALYDINKEKLWVLNSEGLVAIYNFSSNPALLVEEWPRYAEKDVITCFDMVSIEESSTVSVVSPFSIILAGLSNGQIIMIDTRKKFPRGAEMIVQAHSTSIKALEYLKEESLVMSLGTDGIMKCWKLSVLPAQIEDVEALVSLTARKTGPLISLLPASSSTTRNSVSPNGKATHFSINNKLKRVAVGTMAGGVHMYHYSDGGFGSSIRGHPVDEDHTLPITSVAVCASLGLFATASEDATVKVWDAQENVLLRELQFNERVSAVCFSTCRADLLICVKIEVLLVKFYDYLPPNILGDIMASPSLWADDGLEISLDFDVDLDFWEMYRKQLEQAGVSLPNWHIKSNHWVDYTDEETEKKLSALEAKIVEILKKRKRRETFDTYFKMLKEHAEKLVAENRKSQSQRDPSIIEEGSELQEDNTTEAQSRGISRLSVTNDIVRGMSKKLRASSRVKDDESDDSYESDTDTVLDGPTNFDKYRMKMRKSQADSEAAAQHHHAPHGRRETELVARKRKEESETEEYPKERQHNWKGFQHKWKATAVNGLENSIVDEELDEEEEDGTLEHHDISKRRRKHKGKRGRKEKHGDTNENGSMEEQSNLTKHPDKSESGEASSDTEDSAEDLAGEESNLDSNGVERATATIGTERRKVSLIPETTKMPNYRPPRVKTRNRAIAEESPLKSRDDLKKSGAKEKRNSSITRSSSQTEKRSPPKVIQELLRPPPPPTAKRASAFGVSLAEKLAASGVAVPNSVLAVEIQAQKQKILRMHGMPNSVAAAELPITNETADMEADELKSRKFRMGIAPAPLPSFALPSYLRSRRSQRPPAVESPIEKPIFGDIVKEDLEDSDDEPLPPPEPEVFEAPQVIITEAPPQHRTRTPTPEIAYTRREQSYEIKSTEEQPVQPPLREALPETDIVNNEVETEEAEATTNANTDIVGSSQLEFSESVEPLADETVDAIPASEEIFETTTTEEERPTTLPIIQVDDHSDDGESSDSDESIIGHRSKSVKEMINDLQRSKTVIVTDDSSTEDGSTETDETMNDDDASFIPSMVEQPQEVAQKNAWIFLEDAKNSQRLDVEEDDSDSQSSSSSESVDVKPKAEFSRVINSYWFPGLNGKEVNITNINEACFKLMKHGEWKEKCEASRAVLFLYHTFKDDIPDPLNNIILPQLEFTNDESWQFRAQQCANLAAYGVNNPEVLMTLISKLNDKNEAVRKAAKASLIPFGIDSKDSLRAALIQLGMISAPKVLKNPSLLDIMLQKVREQAERQRNFANGGVEMWLANLPPILDGSLFGRPPSTFSTLVFGPARPNTLPPIRASDLLARRSIGNEAEMHIEEHKRPKEVPKAPTLQIMDEDANQPSFESHLYNKDFSLSGYGSRGDLAFKSRSELRAPAPFSGMHSMLGLPKGNLSKSSNNMLKNNAQVKSQMNLHSAQHLGERLALPPLPRK